MNSRNNTLSFRAVTLAAFAWIVAVGVGEAATPAVGTGLTGYYYGNTQLSGAPALVRLEPQISFNWGVTGPGAGIPATYWSARWIGELLTPTTATYTLFAKTDDGVRIWLDDQLVVDSWAARSAADSTYVFAAIAGKRYKIRMDYWQQAGEETATLEWSYAGQTRATVPATQLFPLTGIDVQLPTASIASPAYIEGWRDPTLLPVVTGSGTSVTPSALGATRFYANVPLSPNAAITTQVSAKGNTVTAAVTWTPTAIAGKDAHTDIYRIRIHDQLLLQVPTGVTTAIVTRNSGTAPAITFPTGTTKKAVPFDTAGSFVIQIADGSGTQLGSIGVDVVDVSLVPAIPCGLNFTRNVDVTVDPSSVAGKLWFEANDSLWLTVANGISGATWQRSQIAPLQQLGDPRIVARLSPGGPVIGTISIVPFSIDTSGTNGLLVDPVTRRGFATVVITPFVPNEEIDFSLFAHTSTFLGGAKAFTVNTSSAATSLGEPGFTQVTDATGLVSGILHFSVMMPAGETMYCMNVTGKAGTNLYQAQ